MSMGTAEELPGVADHVRMLDLLGISDDEHLSGLEKVPGRSVYGRVRRAGDLRGMGDLPRDRDFWLSASVIDHRGLKPGSRGTSDDVVRIPAVWADLDLRAGRIDSIDTLWDVVHALADILGVNPAYVVMSGHGLQPVWKLEDDAPSDCARTRALLPRWGALVNTIAVAHGESRVDTVFDAARVLRAPGTRNFKIPDDVVDVEFIPSRHWAPLSLSRIAEACDEYGAHAMEARGVGEDGLVTVPSAPSEWEWADGPGACGYVPKMVAGWRDDVAAGKVVAGHRHHWGFGQHIRLVAARRMGCVTQEEYAEAVGVLTGLMAELRAPDGRAGARPGEVREDARWATARVALKSDAECWAELGGREHSHVSAADLEAGAATAEAMTTGLPSIGEVTPDGGTEFIIDPDNNPLGLIDWDLFWSEEEVVREFVVPTLIPRATVTTVFSGPGAGKSLLGMEWAACLATGEPVMGRSVDRHRVLYIDLENDRDTARERLDDMGFAGDARLKGWLHYSLLGDWPPMDTPRGGAQLLKVVRALDVSVVLIDTTSRVIDGSENDADTFHALYAHSLLALKRMGVTVVRFDHAGKDVDRGERGSSAKRTDVDLSYQLEALPVPTGMRVYLTRKKNRPHLHGADFPETTMLDRTEDPVLRHVPVLAVDVEHEERIAELVREADDAGVADDAGRTVLRAAFRANGTRVSNEDLSEVSKRRRARG